MSKYRDRLQIIADVLSIASRRATKTQIMYQANLSYRLLCRYLGEVMEVGLVSLENSDCYVLTAKGKEFLHRHGEYSKFCQSLEKQFNHLNNEKAALRECVRTQVKLAVISIALIGIRDQENSEVKVMSVEGF